MKTPEEMAFDYGEKFDGVEISKNDINIAWYEGYEAAAPQWIGVKDRLPEVGVSVLLIVADGGFVTSGWLSPQLQVFECAYGHVYWPEQITHWMPLSNPPENPEDSIWREIPEDSNSSNNSKS